MLFVVNLKTLSISNSYPLLLIIVIIIDPLCSTFVLLIIPITMLNIYYTKHILNQLTVRVKVRLSCLTSFIQTQTILNQQLNQEEDTRKDSLICKQKRRQKMGKNEVYSVIW